MTKLTSYFRTISETLFGSIYSYIATKVLGISTEISNILTNQVFLNFHHQESGESGLICDYILNLYGYFCFSLTEMQQLEFGVGTDFWYLFLAFFLFFSHLSGAYEMQI